MEPQEQKQPLTKANFPQDASCHMRDMTPGQREQFLDWVNGLEYVTDKRWPGVLIAKEKWEWANAKEHSQDFARSMIEFDAASVFSRVLEQQIRLLPEDYNPKGKNPDAVFAGRTLDLKQGNGVQRLYRDGRKQALDLYLTVPTKMSLNELRRKIKKSIGSIQKNCPNNDIDFAGSVFFNRYGEMRIYELKINAAGLTQWGKARYGGMGAEQSAPNPLQNITENSGLSSDNPTTGVNSTLSGNKPDPKLVDEAMKKILPGGQKKDAKKEGPDTGKDKGQGRGGLTR